MHHIIRTKQAPAAIGPYNQAVEYNGLIHTAGQIPLDPETGKLVTGTFADRVDQVMRNLQEILTAAGSDFSKVIKTNIYVTDLAAYAELNQVYGKYFTAEQAPARAAIQVAALPLGTDVEIELIAHK